MDRLIRKIFEELPQADQIDLAFDSHGIFFSGQVSLTVGKEKNDIVQVERKPAHQQVGLVRKVEYLALMDKSAIHHTLGKGADEWFLHEILFLNYVAVDPEKV